MLLKPSKADECVLFDEAESWVYSCVFKRRWYSFVIELKGLLLVVYFHRLKEVAGIPDVASTKKDYRFLVLKGGYWCWWRSFKKKGYIISVIRNGFPILCLKVESFQESFINFWVTTLPSQSIDMIFINKTSSSSPLDVQISQLMPLILLNKKHFSWFQNLSLRVYSTYCEDHLSLSVEYNWVACSRLMHWGNLDYRILLQVYT